MKNLVRNNFLYIFILTIYFIQILGCGGSGGDAAQPAVIDITAPIVTQTAPPDNAIDVQLNSLIEVSFNELMNGSTVNTSSFVVKDDLDKLVPGVITESNTTYIYEPNSNLEYDTSYTVIISTSVADLANNNLENIYSWSFSTLSLPGATSPVSLNVSNLTDTTVTLNGVFTNPSGYTTMAWFEYGLTDTYGSSTPSVVYAAVATIDHSSDLINLPDKTIHHYRIVTQNNDGIFYGDDKTFRTYISPVTMADDLDAPAHLHLHNSELYWIEIYSDSVRKVSVSGGATTIEASSTMSGNSQSLDMDMTHLYWGDRTNYWMKPIGIGVATPVATSLALDSNDLRVYLTDLYARASNGSNIYKIAISDGSLTTVVTATSITSIAVDASGIYWTHSGDSISKSAHDGSSVITLAVGLDGPSSLILEAGKLHWAERNAIKSMDTSGGQFTTIANNVSPKAMAKDSTHIYFVDFADTYLDTDDIASVNIATGEINVLTIDQHSYFIVVDDDNIYWLIGGDHYNPPLGQLRKCVKSY